MKTEVVRDDPLPAFMIDILNGWKAMRRMNELIAPANDTRRCLNCRLWSAFECVLDN